MNQATWKQQWLDSWDRFWFSPRSPKWLGIIRLLTGLIVLYTHLVWSFELSTFLGSDAILPTEYRSLLGASAAWSHLDFAGSPTLLWTVHGIGLVVFALFAAGCWTRVTSVLAALLVISYGNRSIGATFGLDQINAFLCLYCAIGNSGAAYSWDSWRKKKKNRGDSPAATTASIRNNLAIRLIQIHMCIVYFFAAMGKLQGETWWTGEAVWLSMASHEYQSLDMTWLAGFLPLVAFVTLLSLFWELAYAALIWPRLTRPIMLAIAVPVHLGIGATMGMMSFGLIMLVGNLAFLSRDEI